MELYLLLADSSDIAGLIIGLFFAVTIIVAIAKTAKVVPQKQAFVVERLGKYSRTLDAGFHLLMPFLDKVSYKHSLKEVAIDVPSQSCITKDNIAIQIDGVLYLQVLDAVKASYGIENYLYASEQLAQTTLRSEIGKIELDKSFEEREAINANIIEALDKAADPWGIKITRYEIANIDPPQTVRDALEKQMRAERERRAVVAASEGERESKINVAEGAKQEIIKQSEADKQRQINEAEGRSKEIELIAIATAEGLRRIADAIQQPGGQEAVNLRIAEQYVEEFGNLAKASNTMIIPQSLSDIGGTVAGLATILEKTQKEKNVARHQVQQTSANNLPSGPPAF